MPRVAKPNKIYMAAKRTHAPIIRINKLLDEAYTTAKILHLSGNDDGVIQARATAERIYQLLPVEDFVAIESMIDYDEREKVFDNCIDDLNIASLQDYQDDTGDQGEAIGKISETIQEWIPDLWQALQRDVDGYNYGLIRKSLLLCHDAIARIGNTRSRYEYEDSDSCTVFDDHNHMIFESHSAKSALTWMWRELLVVSGDRGWRSDFVMQAIVRQKLERAVATLDKGSGHWNASQREVAERLLYSNSPSKQLV